MQEIKEILDKHDIAGVVVLHTPGYGEHLVKVDPSYSCSFIDNTPGVEGFRVRAKLADFNGDSAKKHQVVTDTVNMYSIMTDLIAMRAYQLVDVMEMLKRNVDIQNNKGGHTSETTQMN